MNSVIPAIKRCAAIEVYKEASSSILCLLYTYYKYQVTYSAKDEAILSYNESLMSDSQFGLGLVQEQQNMYYKAVE